MSLANPPRRFVPRSQKIAPKAVPERARWFKSINMSVEIFICAGHIVAAATLVIEHLL